MRIIKKKCIKTNRLILKQIQEEDLGSLIDILKNEEVPLILSLEYLSNFNQCVFSNYVNKKLYKHKGSYVIPFSDKTWTAKLLDK